MKKEAKKRAFRIPYFLLFCAVSTIASDIEELFIVGTITYDDFQGGGCRLQDDRGGCGSVYDLGARTDLYDGMHGLFHIRRDAQKMGPRLVGRHAEIISYREDIRLPCCLL